MPIAELSPSLHLAAVASRLAPDHRVAMTPQTSALALCPGGNPPSPQWTPPPPFRGPRRCSVSSPGPMTSYGIPMRFAVDEAYTLRGHCAATRTWCPIPRPLHVYRQGEGMSRTSFDSAARFGGIYTIKLGVCPSLCPTRASWGTGHVVRARAGPTGAGPVG